MFVKLTFLTQITSASTAAGRIIGAQQAWPGQAVSASRGTRSIHTATLTSLCAIQS